MTHLKDTTEAPDSDKGKRNSDDMFLVYIFGAGILLVIVMVCACCPCGETCEESLCDLKKVDANLCDLCVPCCEIAECCFSCLIAVAEASGDD